MDLSRWKDEIAIVTGAYGRILAPDDVAILMRPTDQPS